MGVEVEDERRRDRVRIGELILGPGEAGLKEEEEEGGRRSGGCGGRGNSRGSW